MNKTIKRSLLLLPLAFLAVSCSAPSSSVSSNPASSVLSSASSSSSALLSSSGGYIMPKESFLHFSFPLNDRENYPNPYIGDVHPYYDEKTDMWYMFYLDTSGQFNTKLLTSKDGLSWAPNEDFWVYSSLANYAVLNVTEKNGVYYSYYAEFQCSKSTDLLSWEYAGQEYQVPLDTSAFKGGMRDPSVIYDKDTDRFYAIGLVYPERDSARGIFTSNLGITVSSDNTNLKWNSVFHTVLKQNQNSHDYECPELMKIGNRWYVFAAHYGFSDHGVGRLSYFIGDENKNPYEVNWTEKAENFLTTEDLCAPQVAKKNDKYYVYGWIPTNYNNGTWGGQISLPSEVYQLPDGSLALRFQEGLFDRVSKAELFASSAVKTLSAASAYAVPLESKRYSFDTRFTLGSGSLSLGSANGNYLITITDGTAPTVKVQVGSYNCFTFNLRPSDLSAVNELKVIAESKVLELELNGKYVMTAKIKDALSDKDSLEIKAAEGEVQSIRVCNLAFLDEIQ